MAIDGEESVGRGREGYFEKLGIELVAIYVEKSVGGGEEE